MRQPRIRHAFFLIAKKFYLSYGEQYKGFRNLCRERRPKRKGAAK
jgi:hypothetical protein